MQIPNSIGTLPNVTAIDLSDNTLTGPIPSSMQNMSKLIILRLHNNMLDGEIPTWLFKITTLMELFIGGKGNSLIWNNEAKIVPNCNLMLLSMSSCNISGQIPEWISSQKDMRQIPMSVSKLNSLEILDLSTNRFFGDTLPFFGDKSNLDTIDLSYNNFSGNIPINFPKGIRNLYLGGNKYSGNIPRDLTKLVNLRILDIHENNITGDLQNTLPQIQTLEVLVLRNNSLQGYIPSNIHNLTSLGILDLSHNNLTGSEIPSSLGNLKALKLLNMSRNMISGRIPVSFGNLQNIESLDLSHNEISGPIPQSLVNLFQLTVLDVSNNKLRGKIPFGGQMDTMNSFENNSGLCGMQIKVTCLEDIRPLRPLEGADEKQSWFLWEGTWVGFPVGFFTSILIMGYFLDFLRLFKIW
ncbi:hypothetical protein L1987_82032 [Smallanthus sonchifolius]|uniref:Uncharacterized protein n=1 Tax=Smallanthus sonchifolius TaxID=185202 RepID=A0ACB8YSU0_9ASTR|nr:hypothetical protein L1987_82032 [Smallanthus sonchifolius]